MNRSKWCSVLALAVAMLASAPARADERDRLEEVRRLNEVAAQALENDVRDAIKSADKLKSDPDKAIGILKGALERLKKDSVLKSEKRIALLLETQERVATLELRAKAGSDARADQPRKPAEEKGEDTLKRDLDHIKALQLDGKYAEAGRLAEELAKRYPDSPAAVQARERARANDGLRDASQIQKDKASGTTGVINSTARSAVPVASDYQLPANWKELSERRQKYASGQLVELSAKEKAIIEMLNGVTTEAISWQDAPLEEVIKRLEKELGVPIHVHKAALDELKIDYTTTLSVSLPKQVSRRTLLRRVLNEIGLTYVVKNEQIEVMNLLRAQNELVTRYFDISDLVKLGGLSGITGQRGADPIQGLIDFIEKTVDPGSWQRNGGPGSIVYFAPTKTLIVRNTAEVINAMGGGRVR